MMRTQMESGLPEILLFFPGMILFLGGLLDLSLPAALELYIAILAASLVGAGFYAYLPEKFRRHAYAPSAILAFVIVILQFPHVKDGCLTVAWRVTLLWKVLHEEITPPIQGSGDPADVWLFLLVACLLLHWMLCSGRNRWSFGLMSVLTVLILSLGVVLHRIDARSVCLLLGSLVAYWMFLVSPLAAKQRAIWTFVCVCVLGAVALADHGTIAAMQAFRDQTKHQIALFRYGEDTLPEGDLHLAWKLADQQDIPRLAVQSGERKDLYLRGFTGDRYADGVWKTLPNSAFQGTDSGMLSWLKEQNFYPLMQYGTYAVVGETDGTPNAVQIENLGANRKYYYESYSIKPDAALFGKARKDNRLASHTLRGIRSTQFEESSKDEPTELLTADDWLWKPASDAENAYVQAEKVYRDFVYRNYTEVSEELSDAINDLFHEKEVPDGVYAATVRIRSVMEQKLHYDEQMPEIPENRDPIRWFLQGNSGNAVLYASTAVEAFRSFGIPARYVEGYLYTADQVQGAGYGQVLTSEHAHAWCEIYMDGMGWMPVDVTPGHYYSTYAMMELLGTPEGVQKARIAEEHTTISELPDETVDGNEGGHSSLWQRGGSILLGVGILVVLILVIGAALALILRKACLWLRRLRAKRQEKTYIHEIWRRIREMLRALGMTAELGMEAEALEAHLRERMPEVQEGMYQDVNRVMEHFYYGGEGGALEPYEIQLLLQFEETLEREILQMNFKERLLFWVRDCRQLLKGERI